MRKSEVSELIRVFVKGGIISPGDFFKVLLVAEKLGAEHVHFGSRQDILIPVKSNDKANLDRLFDGINTEYEIDEFTYQNICCSYVSQDILPSKPWLASHTYHYILDSFDYRPKLRINVVDPSQSLVPLFTGQINFIASNQEDYWYVYLRFREIDEEPWQLPMLVYTEDLVMVAKALEEINPTAKQWDYQKLYHYIGENVQVNNQPVTENLILPEGHFPYYEGINRLTDLKYWLGLYWRNNEYSISILKAIMERCVATEVGKISLTPWKSFIIKGIFEKDIIGWEQLLGSYGMNMRHSALELNWHLPALDLEALELKFYLVRELDKQDISTSGLTFTIKTSDDITLFTSVVIEKTGDELFNILYSRDFNPNTSEYRLYASKVPREVLASLIVELSKMYFENFKLVPSQGTEVQSIKDQVRQDLFQCQQCKTMYDPLLGDESASIPAGTDFDELAEDYRCSLCGSPKSDFLPYSNQSL